MGLGKGTSAAGRVAGALLAPLGLLIVFTTGCQQARPAGMVDAAPPPNFGPTLTRPAAPAPAPVAVAPAAPAAPARVEAPKIVPQRPAVVPPTPVPAGIPREWVATAPPNHWKWIVIHHSATAVGGAARFDKEHRETRHFDELGYHFVIGNGTDTPDGKVEVGPRWPKQKHGAHAQTPSEEFNNFGIGICLVGNFDKDRPSPAQLQSTAKLVAYLMRAYNIPASHVIGHGDTKSTDCPGRNMHVASVRRMSLQILASAGPGAIPVEPPVRTAAANGELLFAVPAH